MPVVVPSRFNLVEAAQHDPITLAMPLRNGAGVVMPEDVAFVFIVYTHRVGSFYLADLLGTSGFFNQPREVIAPEAVLAGCREHNLNSFSEYFAMTAEKSARSQYFILKITIAHLVLLAWHGALDNILGRSRFIVLERMDKVGQVVSWAIADQTRRYYSHPGDPASSPEVVPVYNGDDLRWRLETVVQEIAQANLFLAVNGVVPLHLSYERLIAAPLLAGRVVCKFLGQPDLRCHPALVQLRRQATPLNKAWRNRFLREQNRWTKPQ